jgi:hypothetical protein
VCGAILKDAVIFGTGASWIPCDSRSIDGQPLLKLYCDDPDGRYRTMFETNTGGGCLNKDARRRWERRMYGSAYDGHDRERPKYGNVNFLAHTKGDRAAAHYGSSYMLMNQSVRARCTITSVDSSNETARLGTLQHCAHVLLHKIELCPARKRRDLVEVLFQLGKATESTAMQAIASRVKDLRAEGLEYIELQIHGEVLFEKDLTMVVVAEGATRGGSRLAGPEQTQLWRTFTRRFSAQVFRMSGPAMVPLG